MKTGLRNLSMIAATAAGLSSAAVKAQNNVTILDGGYAEMCAVAAQHLEEPEKIELTGTRLDISPLDICTLAIRDGDGIITNLAGSYNNRGVVLFAQGSLAEALDDFDQAIRLEETLAQAHLNRGYTLMALMRWADSIASFDLGIALGTAELAKAHYNRGIAHEELGHVREAYADYLKASELMPEWEEPKQELARFTVQRR